MSLLLDALKKAEEAKRLSATKGSGATEASTPAQSVAVELSLEPVGAPASSQLPDLSTHLDTLNADLAAVSTTTPLRGVPPAAQKRQPSISTPATEATAEREAIRNVFAAKRTPQPNRALLWLCLAAAGLAAVGIGIWFWWQLQSVGSSALATRPHLPAMPPPQTTAPATPAPMAVAAITPAQPAATEPQSQTEPKAEKFTPPSPSPSASESPVRITRGELRVAPALAKAYDQLQADDLAGAAKSYEQVLRSDSRNTDALLGMAAIALRQGQPGVAEGWYIRVLEADPKDVNAQAGLINLRGQTDPALAESRLKGMLAVQPESAPLNFALGNLYAGQRRWPDAQLAYFNAHTAEPANPDYLFNLAASLDNMHMPKLALEYYQAALDASTKRRAGFDPVQVKARVLELQR